MAPDSTSPAVAAPGGRKESCGVTTVVSASNTDAALDPIYFCSRVTTTQEQERVLECHDAV